MKKNVNRIAWVFLILVILLEIIIKILYNIGFKIIILTIIIGSLLIVLILIKKKEGFANFVMYLIPVVLIGFFIYINYIPLGRSIEFNLDIGDQKSENKYGLTSDPERISEPKFTNNYDTSYREIKYPFIYFKVDKIPIIKDKFKIEVRFKDNFPENTTLNIGVKDKKEWSYKYIKLYESKYKNDKVFSEEDIEIIPKNSLVYWDIDPSKEYTNKIEGYTPQEIVINNSLRGSHEILIYVKDELEFQVSKYDLNWYENQDNLDIELYKGDTLIKKVTIPDNQENGRLFVDDLEEGVYSIRLINQGDMVIKSITTNQNKLILKNEIGIANNVRYTSEKSKITELYTEFTTRQKIKLKITHNESIQTILFIDKQNKTKELTLNELNKWFEIDLDRGEHHIIIPKGDVLLVLNGYISFEKENYFEPYIFQKVKTKQDAEYIISDYTYKKEEGWIISTVSLSSKDAYIEDEKMDFVLNTPHLNHIDQYIPIDWIKIVIED